MITRPFNSSWRAGCEGAPPPLHIVDDNGQSNWFPAPRPYIMGTPAGPTMIYAPIVAPVGDDPTDPGSQTIRRQSTTGMIGRLNLVLQTAGNIGPSGVR